MRASLSELEARIEVVDLARTGVPRGELQFPPGGLSRPPAADPGRPVTLCTSHPSNEIVEAIVKAMSASCPQRAMAGWSRRFRIAIQGEDPRTGKNFIWHLFQARPGGGASPSRRYGMEGARDIGTAERDVRGHDGNTSRASITRITTDRGQVENTALR